MNETQEDTTLLNTEAPQSDMVCPHCRKIYSGNEQFCSLDGHRLVTLDKLIPHCSICGAQYPDGTVNFCPIDGGKVVVEEEVEPQEPAAAPVERVAGQNVLKMPDSSTLVTICLALYIPMCAYHVYFRDQIDGFMGIYGVSKAEIYIEYIFYTLGLLSNFLLVFAVKNNWLKLLFGAFCLGYLIYMGNMWLDELVDWIDTLDSFNEAKDNYFY